jgi:glycerophosphoryl diester phosphodiesterase
MLRSTDITTTITVGILLVAIASADTMAKDMLTDLPVEHPIVIGHRGASGYLPEHTLAAYFIAIEMEEPLVTLLHKYRYHGKHAPVYIQSFEVGNLKDLRGMTRLPLVQPLNDSGKPYDFVLKGDPRTYADLAKPEGLAEIATYADGIGVHKNLIFPRDGSNAIGTPTTRVRDAHAKGLIVHGWTFRAENAFLPANYQSSSDPVQFGDLAGEVKAFLEAGMDGFFTDQPDIGVKARDKFVNKARALRGLLRMIR